MDSKDTNANNKTRLEEHAAGLTLVVLMLWGLWQVSVALQDPALKKISWSLENFRIGHSTNGFSSHIDKKIPAREDLIAWANAGRYVLTRGAGDQVRLGRDEWLFSVEEIQYHPEHQTYLQQRVAMMAQLTHALKQQGVDVLVALVPDKARVHASLLSSKTYPHWYEDRYSRILSTATQEGVAVVDVRDALKNASATQPLYYRTDTHWNQSGAMQAAKAIAADAQQLSIGWSKTSFQTQPKGDSESRVGDLLRMMSLGDMPNWARPNPDTERAETTEKQNAQAAMSLLGDANMPVTLVGTSYSLRANFHGHLQQALQAEVLNVAKDGGGFFLSMKEYLSNESFKTSKPLLLIWEVPERVFSAPLSDDEKKGF